MGNNHVKLEKGKKKEHRKKGRPTQDENDFRLVINQGFTEETLVNSQAGKTNKIGRKPYNEDKKRKVKRGGPLTESVKKRKKSYSSSEDSTDSSDPTSSSARSQHKVFSSFYTDTAAKEEERKQFASPWGQGLPTSAAQGNFINIRTAPLRRDVFTTSAEVEAAKWVCLICYPGGSGTGFRVGPRYIMTAMHVVQEILRSGHQLIGTTHNVDQYAALAQPGVFARFNFLTHNQPSCRDIWTFKPLLRFYDGEVDTAVLELEDSAQGTPMPLPFTAFGIPVLNDKFTFIGHTGGETQQLDIVDKCIDINSEETSSTIITVKQHSLQIASSDYESPPHILAHPHRFLFNCLFSKGASGSPGVIVLADGKVVVVTMLLRGFPDWYYDSDVPQHFKNIWPRQYCVEQGANMISVYNKMMASTPALCQEIFNQRHESGTEDLPPPDL